MDIKCKSDTRAMYFVICQEWMFIGHQIKGTIVKYRPMVESKCVNTKGGNVPSHAGYVVKQKRTPDAERLQCKYKEENDTHFVPMPLQHISIMREKTSRSGFQHRQKASQI